VAVDDGFGEVVISEGENADDQSFLGHADVFRNAVHILLVGEKQCVHVAGLGSKQVLRYGVSNLAEVFQDIFGFGIFHFFSSCFENHVKGLRANQIRVAVGHAVKLVANVSHFKFINIQIIAFLQNFFNSLVTILDFGVLGL
jgi:hypothetical protein